MFWKQIAKSYTNLCTLLVQLNQLIFHSLVLRCVGKETFGST